MIFCLNIIYNINGPTKSRPEPSHLELSGRGLNATWSRTITTTVSQ